MSQSGYTPIYIYNSGTATNVPLAANLGAGELAINYTDGKLFYKDNGGVVQVIATKSGATATVSSVSVVSANGLAGTVANATTTPAITLSTTITGLLKGNGTAISAAVSGTDYAPATSGTSILYGNGSGGFSNVTVSTGLTFSGGVLTATGTGGTVTSVSGTGTVNGITLTGTVTSSGSITLGGTLSGVSLTSQVSGILPIANGGTNLSSYTTGDLIYASATNTLSKLGIGLAGQVLSSNGTTISWSSSSGGVSIGQTFFIANQK